MSIKWIAAIYLQISFQIGNNCKNQSETNKIQQGQPMKSTKKYICRIIFSSFEISSLVKTYNFFHFKV